MCHGGLSMNPADHKSPWLVSGGCLMSLSHIGTDMMHRSAKLQTQPNAVDLL